MDIETIAIKTGADLLAYCEKRSQSEEKETTGVTTARPFRIVQAPVYIVISEAARIWDALQNPIFLEQVPHLVELDLNRIFCDERAPRVAVCAAGLLQSGRGREGLILNLVLSHIDNSEAQILAEALESEKCPRGLTLDLSQNQISSAGFTALANALKSGKCPRGLTLRLGDLFADSDFVRPRELQALLQPFAEALERGNCPEDLTLDLHSDCINSKAFSVLAQAIGSGQCPRGLTLNLSKNYIRDEGVFALVDALGSGNGPSGLTLNLAGNNIGDIDAKAFAQLIASGRCPEGLTLDLSKNSIKDEGFLALAEALGSEACPCGLTLILKSTPSMSDTAAQAFAKLIASGGLKEGVNVDLGIPADKMEMLSAVDSKEVEPGMTPEPAVEQSAKDAKPLTLYQRFLDFGKKTAPADSKKDDETAKRKKGITGKV